MQPMNFEFQNGLIDRVTQLPFLWIININVYTNLEWAILKCDWNTVKRALDVSKNGKVLSYTNTIFGAR